MATYFGYKNIPTLEDTETITITRRTPNATTPTIDDIVTIYTGAADVQSDKGYLHFNPSGGVPEYDAFCIIDATSAGVLPVVKQGDVVVVTGGNNDTYSVIAISTWTLAPKHLELTLKKGGMHYAGALK